MNSPLMDLWAKCQPVRVVPQPGDTQHHGHLCRRINGVWCELVPMAGDWYRCTERVAAELDALHPAPQPEEVECAYRAELAASADVQSVLLLDEHDRSGCVICEATP